MVTAKLTQCHQRVVHADHLRYALPLFSLAIHLPALVETTRVADVAAIGNASLYTGSLLSILDLIKM